MDIDPDWPIRLAAFNALKELVSHHGSELDWEVIARGFSYQGERLLFANRARGIFKPARMRGAALSIKTTRPRKGREARYDDLSSDEGFVYRFQGDDPDAHDNRALQLAQAWQTPLIYFYGIEPGRYAPIWPVYITEFDAAALSCVVLAESGLPVEPGTRAADARGLQIERRYATVEVKRRLHQQAFRIHVLHAYEDRCAICNLPRRELLEASHIVPDHSPRGVPEVPNGLALCQLHHGAFDANLLGVRPDGVVEVSKQLLDEHDGPVLELGLKGFNGRAVRLPSARELRPKAEYLEERYELFQKVGT